MQLTINGLQLIAVKYKTWSTSFD